MLPPDFPGCNRPFLARSGRLRGGFPYEAWGASGLSRTIPDAVLAEGVAFTLRGVDATAAQSCPQSCPHNAAATPVMAPRSVPRRARIDGRLHVDCRRRVRVCPGDRPSMLIRSEGAPRIRRARIDRRLLAEQERPPLAPGSPVRIGGAGLVRSASLRAIRHGGRVFARRGDARAHGLAALGREATAAARQVRARGTRSQVVDRLDRRDRRASPALRDQRPEADKRRLPVRQRGL